MRAGGVAGRADPADELAGANDLPGTTPGQGGEVAVEELLAGRRRAA